MSGKRKLSKSEDYDSNSDFEDEKKVSNKGTERKKRALIESDSEDELEVSDQSFKSKDESLCSDENMLQAKTENTSKVEGNSTVNTSDSSDDEPLATKTGEKSKRVEVSDDDKPLSKIAKVSKPSEKSKQLSVESSDSSDNETSNKALTRMSSSHSETGSEKQNSRLETSSDDDEPLAKIAKEKSREMETLSVSSDEDEPLSVKSKRTSKHLGTNNVRNLNADSDNSSEEDQPVIKLAKVSELNGKYNEKEIASSNSSDDSDKQSVKKVSKHLKRSKAKKLSSESLNHGHDSNSEDDEPLSKVSGALKRKQKSKEKYSSSNDSSDDEPLAAKMPKKERNSNVSSEGNKPKTNSTKAANKNSNPKKSKTTEDRIERLKKYLRLSGIRVNSYEKLFEDCKSVKSKVDKLLAMLHEKGMKGQPTIEKCKKLREKIETRKEIAELDTSNIIKSEGRPKRGSGSKFIEKKQEVSSPLKKRFSHLKDIIDSEESD